MDSKHIYDKLNELKEELKNLKKLEEEKQKEIDSISSNCAHEYILVCERGKELVRGEVYRCCCLICDKRFSLSVDEYKKIKGIKEICLIDVTKEIRKFDFLDMFMEHRYGSIEIAKNILDKYLNEEYENYDNANIRYRIRKEILENFDKKEKIKIKIRND